jgi:hypothetical protein
MQAMLSILSALNSELLVLLPQLTPTDWNKQTGYKNWNIQKVLLHLISYNLQLLFEDDVPSFLNEELAMLKDYSKSNTVSAIEIQTKIIEIFKQLKFDSFTIENEELIANSYTKNWLLQQYIRQALNNTRLLQSRYYLPYLNILMQALPETYKSVIALKSTTLKVEIVGEAGGNWVIEKKDSDWSFSGNDVPNPDALVYIDQNIAWLLFSNGIDILDARQYYQIHGDADLASHALKLQFISS